MLQKIIEIKENKVISANPYVSLVKCYTYYTVYIIHCLSGYFDIKIRELSTNTKLVWFWL